MFFEVNMLFSPKLGVFLTKKNGEKTVETYSGASKINDNVFKKHALPLPLRHANFRWKSNVKSNYR